MRASDYREKARQMLDGNWGKAILVTLVAGLLGGLLMQSSSGVNFNSDKETLMKLPEAVRTYFTVVLSIASVLAIVQFIIGGTVRLGYAKYLLNLHDGKEGSMKDLFSEFDRLGDAFIMSLLEAIYVALWSMLFVIPGVIAVYKYAMSSFILLENPWMKPKEAITASKNLMHGHKFELFVLGLSFIGWNILNLFTLGIGSLWLSPYMNASYAAFYRWISHTTPTWGHADAFDASEPVNPWQ